MVRRDRVFWAVRKKVALVRDRAGKGDERVGFLGTTLLGTPFRTPVPGVARGHAPSAGSVVPPLSPPSGGGGRRGCFPSSLPHLPAPPRQKSAPPLLADGLSSCDSVLAWGGRVAGVRTASGRPFSPPGQADPSGEASCLCVAGMPSLILSISVPGTQSSSHPYLFHQLPGSWFSSRLG